MNISRKRSAIALAAFVLVAPSVTVNTEGSYAQGNSRTFPETGKTVKGRFLEYWNQNGGLSQQGFPISEEMQERSDTDGKTYTVQYFERAVFEMHPENARPYDVLLSLLGNSYYRQKYPNGAPNQRASTTNPRRFTETGRTIGGRFRQYWEQNGGLAQQGFPISDEFQERSPLDGKTYTVQYFERAVFEMHPENRAPFDVLLSQLGKFQYDAKYAQAASEVKVDIVDYEYKPKVATVKVGGKVTWVQVDVDQHNVVHKGNLFESKFLKKGETFSHTFNTAGTYDYLCTIHPEMVGQVVVK